uniref:SWIM-type domain-containing protein n=1 Tax=Parascaris univalens TaxID=6257 RepID=A0A914ZV07_PARUN
VIGWQVDFLVMFYGMPRSFGYLLLASVILTTLGAEEQQQNIYSSTVSTDRFLCPLPGGASFAPKNANYCIYAIGYTEEAYGDNLFYNKDSSDYADQLEAAATPACAQNQLSEPQYSGGWMHISNGTINIFFVCCKECAHLGTSKLEALLTLKNVFTARSYLNVKKIYEHIETDAVAEGVVYRERYVLMMENENRTQLIDLPTCLSQEFRIIPSFVNTPMCWVKATAERRCEACGDPPTYKEFLNLIEKTEILNLTLGPYDAFHSRHMEGTHCANDMKKSTCLFWDTPRRYNMECCCLGSEIERMHCQEELSKGGRKVDGQQPNCAVRTLFSSRGEENITSVQHVVSQLHKTISPINASFDDILASLNKHAHCTTHLVHVPWHQQQYLYLHQIEQFLLPAVNLSYIEEAIPNCERLSVDDYRIRDISVRQCYPGIPLESMCPFQYYEYNRTEMATSMHCCCNSVSFCNYKGEIRARTLYLPMQLCHYNNNFQQLFNKYAINDTMKHHSCLVHYANADVMRDIYEESGSEIMNSSVLNVLPGAPLIPIDYAYAFLSENNSCGYVETLVHKKYLATRRCKSDVRLNTEFLPLKLYVCRCKTPVDEGKPLTPCDIHLRMEIARREEEEQTKKSASICAVYSQLSSQHAVSKKTVEVNNRISGACHVAVRLSHVADNGMTFSISAGPAVSRDVNEAGILLNHIGYSLYERTGDPSTRCFARSGTAHCFCRSYEDGSACNARMSEVKATIREAITSLLRKDRLHYDIGLTSLQKDTDATTCRHRGSVAVITYNPFTGKSQVKSNCLYRREKTREEGLVCRRNFTTGRKCVLRSGRVICCCIEEEECRQLESSVWGLMNAIQYIERRY